MAVFAHLLAHPLRFALSALKMTCLTHLTFSHLVQISPAQGPSMLPTFSVDGDWVLADMTARHGRRLRVGDLAIYKIPIFPSSIGAKRVIAMPGDYVSLGTPGEKGGHRMIQVSPLFSSPGLGSLTQTRSPRVIVGLPATTCQPREIRGCLGPYPSLWYRAKSSPRFCPGGRGIGWTTRYSPWTIMNLSCHSRAQASCTASKTQALRQRLNVVVSVDKGHSRV